MKSKILISFISLCLFASQTFAQSSDLSSEKEAELIKNVLKTQIDGVSKLPITGIQLIEAGGKTFSVSDNGRFVMVGKIFDMWNGIEIKGVADANKYATKIDLQKLGINFDELNPVVIGNGRSVFIVFVDPNCPHCHKILVAANKMKKHTFKFVMVPLLGGDSIDKSKKGVCHTDRPAVMKALIDNQWEKIPVGAPECGLVANQKSIVLARILGVTSVPFAISVADGSIQQGVPPDFAAWADEHSIESLPRNQKNAPPSGSSVKKPAPDHKN